MTLDEDGQVVEEKDLSQLRTFTGHVDGVEGSLVSLVISPIALYGVVQTSTHRYSLQPPVEAVRAGVYGVQEVVVRESPPINWDFLTLTHTTTPQTHYKFKPQPYSDWSYRDYAPDYASRIASAYAYVRDMWSYQLNIWIHLQAIYDLPSYLAFYQNDCGGVLDSGMAEFRDQWVQYNTISGVNVYVLFYAFQGPGNGVAGCTVPLNLQPYNSIWYQASAAITARDWYWSDSYDPDETDHLGLAAGHENSHNLGEDAHPTDSRGTCDSNIMAHATFWCTYPWLAGSSVQKISNWAYPRLEPI